MTLNECEVRNEATIKNAIKWANNRDCQPLEQFDIALICEYLKMNTPKYVYNFVSSNCPDNIKAYASHKSLFKLMDTLKNKIINGELNYVTFKP